ncbi:peptidase S8 and S53 subtilisin kexin sedolisin (plasmid) [Deinococcus psychrotolerans]|uniref:Peptidase S8 and S53 subtilisin kexin sedolisin n=1 Tax=Deinococcus psychrotolerans TaxID=2489213 RepID=A0A3G8YI12_9DEIO|nr:S8 family serine peptidase [Deinococcus psychrotolerans]AZI44595.1 peptidase S8 and S53 subtilisin kexin sedolisin [Deinococcus psychrotolerans]
MPQSRFTSAGAQILAWHPEEGFALLGWQQAPLSVQAGQTSEANVDLFSSPEVQSSGVWAGGRSAWGGGSNHSAWSPDLLTQINFSQNSTTWKQIDLSGGRLLAPKLGAGIKIAVIDTGVDLNHPGLQGHFAPASEWKDFVDGDAVPQEVQPTGAAYGHGTGVAGILVQIAPKAVILPIRVLRPDGSGDLSAVVQAMDWAISKGAKIINVSLGSNTSSLSLNSILSLAAMRGVLLVASAGNNNQPRLTSPAANTANFLLSSNYLISVGSVDADDVKSSFSNYAYSLKLMAPGEHIYTAVPNNQVGYWSGTSFAAPMVSGALALALGQGAEAGSLPGKLASGSDDILSFNKNYAHQLGSGRLNLGKFLKSINSGSFRWF